MFGASSPNSPSSLASKNSPFNFGQFVSRQFNFVYVAGSISFLAAMEWTATSLSLWERLLRVVGALVCNVMVVQVIKLVCYLPRPNSTNSFCWGRRPHSGFPSGHTVPAFLLATFVASAYPVWGLVWFAAATLIAWARWRTEAHYAYQVVLSAFLGMGLGIVMVRFLGM